MQAKYEPILEKIRTLQQLYNDGKIKQAHQHEVNPGLSKECRENYLYFTLPVSINYQRSSPGMWASALKTYRDPETNYLFYPEKVVENSFEKVQADLTKHSLALQKNKHVLIWQKISETLYREYNSDPREIIRSGENNVIKILEQVTRINKKQFPYLSGAKMSNYWIYILHNFTDAQFRNINNVSIIPDTHVQQCSTVLGISEKGATPQEVAQRWFEILEGTGINPIDLHPILWNWSRAGFYPSV